MSEVENWARPLLDRLGRTSINQIDAHLAAGEAQFQTQVASDIVRDGLGIELVSADVDVLAEAFRCDADRALRFSAFATDLPLAAVRMLIGHAIALQEAHPSLYLSAGLGNRYGLYEGT